jgi:hypothetical protein
LTIHEHDDDPNRDLLEQKFFQRKQLYLLVFFLGTILAALGWFIEFKGLDELSARFAKLTILALVGHVLQVVAMFGYLLVPDQVEEEKRGSSDPFDPDE